MREKNVDDQVKIGNKICYLFNINVPLPIDSNNRHSDGFATLNVNCENSRRNRAERLNAQKSKYNATKLFLTNLNTSFLH